MEKALDQNVYTRYQTAADLIADLRNLRARLTPRLELVANQDSAW